MLTWQLTIGCLKHISVKSYLKIRHFQCRKFIWKCCLFSGLNLFSITICHLVYRELNYLLCKVPNNWNVLTVHLARYQEVEIYQTIYNSACFWIVWHGLFTWLLVKFRTYLHKSLCTNNVPSAFHKKYCNHYNIISNQPSSANNYGLFKTSWFIIGEVMWHSPDVTRQFHRKHLRYQNVLKNCTSEKIAITSPGDKWFNCRLSSTATSLGRIFTHFSLHVNGS